MPHLTFSLSPTCLLTFFNYPSHSLFFSLSYTQTLTFSCALTRLSLPSQLLVDLVARPPPIDLGIQPPPLNCCSASLLLAPDCRPQPLVNLEKGMIFTLLPPSNVAVTYKFRVLCKNNQDGVLKFSLCNVVVLLANFRTFANQRKQRCSCVAFLYFLSFRNHELILVPIHFTIISNLSTIELILIA